MFLKLIFLRIKICFEIPISHCFEYIENYAGVYSMRIFSHNDSRASPCQQTIGENEL